MTLEEFNQLSEKEAFDSLYQCCASEKWASQVSKQRPYSSLQALLWAADQSWEQCGPEDTLEAFAGHPKIGDVKSLAKKYAATKSWAGNEQSGVDAASQSTIEALATGNQEYEKRYGYIFIVCATGKSADEMLDILNSRMNNEAETEFKIARGEQHKITHIRLKKLIA
ncbi:MAG: 2-oxo-4-hydroxy-4-carboxy-5-ureidoimidazoline decarboxylase [Bacteroidetes bacterium]|nr:MAG: 2-oxo-4-hydroxy-4-carboxy-5-ureidoimidazoline decarboxylase [Bacteroidota bacterium]